MKFRDLFRRDKKSAVDTTKQTAIPITPGSFLEFALGGGGQVQPSTAMSFYRQCASVATAVDMIADEVEFITPMLVGPDGSYIDDSDVLKLLRKPNSLEDWSSFVGALARNYLLARNAPMYAGGNVNRPPLELFAPSPTCLSVVQDGRDRYPHTFQVSQGVGQGVYTRMEAKGAARFYDGNLRELYRIGGYGSRGPSFPDSPLEAAALEARQQILGRYHNLSLLKNGGRLSLIVQFKDAELGQDELEERRNVLNRVLGGAENAGRIATVASNEMAIHEAGTANKDMDYSVLDQVAGDAIYLRYKVPLPLVRIGAATYDNVRQSTYQLYDRAVVPLAKRLFSGLSAMLLPRYGLDPSQYRIAYNPDHIAALVERRWEEIKLRKEINVETPNEIRDLIPGRGPIKGGDILYQPATLVPVGKDLFTDDERADDVEQ
ncbi:phage portal protein [Lysobacter sp. GCM10012299]|uniref:phage portal protein n=1 Tax=Lysobacter sp. GCM10012299 TaxID=3317333 RepID=UPI00360C0C3F